MKNKEFLWLEYQAGQNKINLTGVPCSGTLLSIIATFKNRQLKKFWETGKGQKLPANLRRPAMRKLKMLDDAQALDDLKTLPGNNLEALLADRKGQYSIRINNQFRVCFRWQEGKAYDVEIVDYHG